MRWHSQGLSKNEAKRPHGRGWLYFGDESSRVIGVEWVLGARKFALTLDLNWVDGCDGVMLHLAFPFLVSLYITLGHIIPKAWLPGHWEPGPEGRRWWYPEQREIGVSIHDQTVWFKLWANPMEWHRDQPWWWEFSVAPIDILLGKENYTTRDIEQGEIVIPMPEGDYLAKYRVFESTWKRPRWPKTKQIVRTDIDLMQSIPFSGKGENSWDCGEDGLWGITIPTKDPSIAAVNAVTAVLETRRKRGDPLCWPVAPQVV